MTEQLRQTVLNLLEKLPTRKLDALKQLLWSELNYDRANTILSTRDWQQNLQQSLIGEPLLFATAGDGDGFHVIYSQLKTDHLQLGVERQIISNLIQSHPFTLFIFSDSSQVNWHFVNVKYDRDDGKRARRVFRRITVSPYERLRTAAERIGLLDTATLSRDLFGISPLIVQQRHDEAFNVEAVTERFFDSYQQVFNKVKNELNKQTNDQQWAHEYSLQFLNRLMFLYYVQRKLWLGRDPDFLAHFWNAYLDSDHTLDTFVSNWLNILFFEAFNNQFQAGRADHQHFSKEILDALAMAPYLNGGLFTRNRIDGMHSVLIDDSLFKTIFQFFESYNFTISEDTPLDQEVAVDPEMIGKVYESLVNVSEEADERGEAGIFYTPRVEIDLMCRLSLVNYLANQIENVKKSVLYEFVFAFENSDKELADQEISNLDLWPTLEKLLRSLTVVDPACGSGSFLVGMLYVLDDLRCRSNKYLGREETAYERKKDIIRNSLYGVDVMRWAVHVAELRLWLQLVIDTQLETAELKFHPLLPNLSFKIRPGDSLVQEVGGLNLAIRHGGEMPSTLKGKITSLKGEKLKFYNNEIGRKYNNETDLRHAESLLFNEILDNRILYLENRVNELKQGLLPPKNLFGEVTSPQMNLNQAVFQQELSSLQIDLENARKARAALGTARDIPFVWDIAFVEVFQDDKNGFDIVIGNPPYVRQEKIRDPLLPLDIASTPEAKKAYKAKLARSIYMRWPLTFGYNWSKGDAKWKLDAKSDLYIYFYFYGLSLLNPGGTFCFITSNSWLDVGYGKDLQQFLLSRGQVILVIDNQSRRSFASADVNTVIALLGQSVDSRQDNKESLSHTARFVMLTASFEQTLSPVVWEEAEEATVRSKSAEYRVFPISQSELLSTGIDPESQKYMGGKWGGKYLRAPDIFFTILAKGQKYEELLGNYFEGERYLNTGGADGFFIINDVIKVSDEISLVKNPHVTSSNNFPFEGHIENKFLVPLIKDYTRDHRKIEVEGYDAYCLVIKGAPSPNVIEYIKWGEAQGYNLRSVTRNQHPWYKPTNQMLQGAKILVPRSFNDTFVIHYNPQELLSLRFYRLHLKKGEEKAILGYLNSTLISFFLETLGNKSLGQGVLDFFMADFLALRIPVILNEEISEAFDRFKNRQIGNIWEELGYEINQNGSISINLPEDRRNLDELIFDAIGLSQEERKSVYEEMIRMVDDRLKKASSLSTKRTAQQLTELEW